MLNLLLLQILQLGCVHIPPLSKYYLWFETIAAAKIRAVVKNGESIFCVLVLWIFYYAKKTRFENELLNRYTLSKKFQQQQKEVSRCSYPNKKFPVWNNKWQTINSNLTDCNLRSKIFAFVFLKVLYLLWSSKLCVVDHFSSKSHSGPSAVGQDLSRPKMHIWHGKEPERKKIHGIVFVGCSLTSAWHRRHFSFLARDSWSSQELWYV